MARWGIVCTNCDSVITHSLVADTLQEHFQTSTPEMVSPIETQCPECNKTISYGRTDLRYFAR